MLPQKNAVGLAIPPKFPEKGAVVPRRGASPLREQMERLTPGRTTRSAHSY
jgi:hypothetical protein